MITEQRTSSVTERGSFPTLMPDLEPEKQEAEDISPTSGEPQPVYLSESYKPRACRSALLRAGIWSFLGYCAFWVLMQSQALWARPVALPGGASGIFGKIRRLFPEEWLLASATSWLGFANSLLYLSLLVFLFWVYWRVLRLAFRSSARSPWVISDRRALWTAMCITALILLVLLFVPGTMSADLHSYIWYGRIFYDYGANPFLHAPVEFASQDTGRWLDLVYWKDTPSVYGPVWVWLAGGVAWVAGLFGGDISLHLLGHRLLAGIAHMINVFLVWRVAGLVISRYWRRSPPQPDVSEQHWTFGSKLGATLFYAWNPLLLVEFGANGHNDVMLLTLMLGGLWLYLEGRWRMAAVGFALACMMKVVALLWWPGFLWLLFWNGATPLYPKARHWVKPDASQEGLTARLGLAAYRRAAQGIGRVAQAAAIAAITWTICYLPFWEGAQTLQPLVEGPASKLFVNSLAAMVRFKGGEWLHEYAVVQGWPGIAGTTADSTRVLIEGWIRWLAWGIVLVLGVRHTWRGRTLLGMLKGWGWLLFFYLTIGAVWFWPWYVAWLIVPVALVGPGRLMTATLILCLTSLSLYAIYPKLPAAISEVIYWRALLTVAPALVYVGTVFILQRNREIRAWHGLIEEGTYSSKVGTS